MARAQKAEAAPKLKIKKGDRVVVITGRDRGKTGEVLRVIPKDLRVVVQGINMVKKHRRPSAMGAGGIEDMEAPIHISNVAHIDPSSNKPTRVGYRMEGERKVRFSRRSGELIDR